MRNISYYLQKEPFRVANILARMVERGDHRLTRIFNSISRITSLQVVPRVVLASQSPRRRDILRTLLGHDDFDIGDSSGTETLPGHHDISVKIQTVALQKLIWYLDWVVTQTHHVAQSESNKNTSSFSIGSVILAADTMILLEEGTLVGKFAGPHDRTPQTEALDRLVEIVGRSRGKRVTAYTGIVAANLLSFRLDCRYASSMVQFRSVTTPLGPGDYQVLVTIADDFRYAHVRPLLDRSSLVILDVLEAYVQADIHAGKAGGFNLMDRDFFLCVDQINGDPFTTIGLPFTITRELLSTVFNVSAIQLEDAIWSAWPLAVERKKFKSYSLTR